MKLKTDEKISEPFFSLKGLFKIEDIENYEELKRENRKSRNYVSKHLTVFERGRFNSNRNKMRFENRQTVTDIGRRWESWDLFIVKDCNPSDYERLSEQLNRTIQAIDAARFKIMKGGYDHILF